MDNRRKKHLFGMTQKEIEAACGEMGERNYRARQIIDWIYRKQVADFDEMLNLPKEFRTKAAAAFSIYQSTVEKTYTASDDTIKLLLKLNDTKHIETVLIPDGDRLTCCMSSQVGCGMGCTLCASGICGFERNLTAGEFVEQVMQASRVASRRITHLVVMGIGEPLANYKEVVNGLKILNADWGLNIAARRITLSTVGLPPAMERLANEGLQLNLAISLHASNDEMRNKIVPSNKHIGIDRILHAARVYFERTGRQVTIEYALMAGINTGIAAAEELADRLHDLECIVNVIPYNPVAEAGLKAPSPRDVQDFVLTLQRRGINVTVRRQRGVDIQAACGQLRAERLNR